MRSILKPLLLIFVILGSYVAVAAWGFWAVVIRPGVVWIDVASHNRHHQSNLSVGIPSILVDSVVNTISTSARVRHWSHDWSHNSSHHSSHHDEIEEWAPMIGAIARELENSPDFVLVDVEDSNDHVTVERINGAIRVRVSNDRENVSIIIPQESSRRVLRALGTI